MMTAVMLWINHSTIYWFDEGRLSKLDEAAINNILNALQLLAKIYEIAVLASLAHISIKVFKRRLVGKGLPAGMVTAGYRVGDLFYLASPEFWSGRKGAALFVIFLFINTMLTVLMGPASAILIVPKLGRFRVRAPFFPGAVPVFMDTPDLHWPDLLDDGVVANITECAQEPANYKIGCPGSGFGALYTWASGWEMAGLSDHVPFPDHSGRITRQLQKHNGAEGTFATTPMSVVASTVGQLRTMIADQFIGHISLIDEYRLELADEKQVMPVYQPLVNSKCFVWNESEMEAARQTRAGDSSKMGTNPFFNCFSGKQDDRCHRTSRLLSDRMRDARVPARNAPFEMTYNLSIGAEQETMDGLPLTSPLFSASLPYTVNGSTEPRHRFVLCGAMAHWIPASFSIESNKTDLLQTSITDLGVFERANGWREATNGGSIDRTIHFDESWLKYLDPVFNNSGRGERGSVNVAERSTRLSLLLSPFLSDRSASNNNTSTFEPGSEAEDTTPDETTRSTIESFIAVVLTDAISRTHGVVERGPLMYFLSNGTAAPGEEPESVNLRRIHATQDQFGEEFKKLVQMRILDLDTPTPELIAFLEKRSRTHVSLNFNAYRYGYGFGRHSAQPLGTVVFALAVVYAYVVILLSYAVFVAVRWSPVVDAWGDLHDLVTLAWSSAAPAEIVSQGSGVRRKGFVKETVAIRAASAGGAVSLVRTEDEVGMVRLRKGEKYL
jgi:hypothetical protein